MTVRAKVNCVALTTVTVTSFTVIALLVGTKVVMTSLLTSPWATAVSTVTVPLAFAKFPVSHLR